MKKVIIIGAVIGIVVIAILVAFSQMEEKDVQTYVVKKSNIEDYIEVRGKVELSKKNKVFSKLGGIVLSIKANEGDAVDTTSELALIDVPDLNIALNKAEVSYNSSIASLNELKNSIKSEDIKQAQYQVDQGKIAVDSATQDYNTKNEKLNKSRVMYEKHSIPKQEMEDAEALANAAKGTLEDAEIKYKIATNNLDILKKGVSKESLSVAEASVEQARLNIDELKSSKGKASVYSANKGVILEKFVQEGETVQQGTSLFEVGDMDSSYISIDVLVDDARKIAIGNKVVISGEVIKDNPIDGEIYFISPKALTKVSSLGVEQQRIEMRIKYDSSKIKKDSLKLGYNVDVKVITQVNESVLGVPDKAIISKNGSKSVFIVKNGVLELKEVKVGIENSNIIEIVDGISENDVVVVDPSNDLKPNIKVSSKN